MKKVKFLSLLTAFSVAAAMLTGCSGEKGEMRDMSTMEIVQDMGVGINLGNTFESMGQGNVVRNYETGWGSPVITQEMIQGYADCGFGVLRGPVSWSNMMSGDYEISLEYMARVTEVVDWALDSGMYVILNIHWDGGWFSRFAKEEDREECFYKYERIWTQLCAQYKNYSDRLMFESLNEEGGWEEIWNRYSNEGDKELSYSILNDINQRFVNIVRKSGGNNKKRHLLIAGYNTDIELTCDPLYKMPDDPEGRCAVSVHYYTPPTFAIIDKDVDWGKAQSEWGSDADYAELNKYMDMMKTTYVDKGIPVIIGEFAAATRNKTDEMLRLYLSSVCEAGYTRGMCPVLWDVTDVCYLRREARFKDPVLLEELMAVKELERN